MELTLDLSAFTFEQRYELLALIESFAAPRYIPSADEKAEHSAPAEIIPISNMWCAAHQNYHPHFPHVYSDGTAL